MASGNVQVPAVRQEPSSFADFNESNGRKRMNVAPVTQQTSKSLESNRSAGEGHEVKSTEHAGDDRTMMIVCFLGIFISYFIYGLLQEKISKTKFGNEYFRFFVFLVFVQCIVNATFARVVCSIKKLDVSLLPYNLFSVLAFTYVGAMVASNSSLSFISYPTQVLGKSAKPIPILVIGVLLGGKRYSLMKYLIVLLIVMGVAMFLYKEGHHREQDDQFRFLDFLGYGEMLVLLSLFLDGCSGALQERLRDLSIGAYHMMYAVNLFSAIYLGVTVLVSGEIFQVMTFIHRHPIIIVNIFVFSVASAVGQNFIFWTVTRFGPLTTSLFTTTRKFFTILASVLFFGNTLMLQQWVGVFLVFLGLGIDALYGKPSRQK